MACPQCHDNHDDRSSTCPGCGFSLSALAERYKRRLPDAAHVLDAAGSLTDDEEAELLGQSAALSEAGLGELAFVILPTTAPISPAEMAFWLLNHWQLGGRDHRGVLVLVALEERRIEIEVGYALEATLSDAAADALLEQAVVPHLQEHGVAAGLQQAATVIAHALRSAAPNPEDT
ncbi:MAG: hypothetical protein ACI9OJ_002484 [Myxococcota bacterium]